jgi:guanylate cyclase
MAVRTSKTPLTSILNIGKSEEDPHDLRLQKSLLVSGSFMFIVAGTLWGIGYFLLNEPIAAIFPLSYAIISFICVYRFHTSRDYDFFCYSQLGLILLLPFLLMVALGGYVNSSAVILWSLICPLGALLFSRRALSIRWLLAYLLMLALSALIQPYLRLENNLPQALQIAFFVLNIGAVSTIAFVLLNYFVGQKDLAYRLLSVEQDRSESLLLNVLPQQIAARLKSGEKTIADYHPSVSILFADLVGFTPLTDDLSPTAMVELLNDIYSHFDSLIEKYGVEKIRTIGDNYMIAAGLPAPGEEHAKTLARVALEMNAYVAGLATAGGRRLSFRFGINSGPVIAGVIGHKKFAYDVWGDTVNTASRMESQGKPGMIQITQATYDLIKDDFECELHGPVNVKGKGEMLTWFLIGAQA